MYLKVEVKLILTKLSIKMKNVNLTVLHGNTMYISPIVQCHRHRNNPYQQGTSKFDKYIGSYCYPDRLFKTSYVSPLFFQLNGNHIYVFQIVNEHSYKITQNYVFFLSLI